MAVVRLSRLKVTLLLLKAAFLIASMLCVSDLKKDFVVGVDVVLDAELLSTFPQNWIVLRLEKITQFG